MIDLYLKKVCSKPSPAGVARWPDCWWMTSHTTHAWHVKHYHDIDTLTLRVESVG